jgi:hypothetical protein
MIQKDLKGNLPLRLHQGNRLQAGGYHSEPDRNDILQLEIINPGQITSLIQ